MATAVSLSLPRPKADAYSVLRATEDPLKVSSSMRSPSWRRKMAKRRRRLPSTAATVSWSCCVLLVLRCSAIYVPETPGTSAPEYCTVFNHMVKSGGTSIKEQLVQASLAEGHKPPGLCTTDASTTDEQCREALYDSNVIMGYGEVLRNPLQKIGRDCEFFTMLRHPISRLVSAFYYCPGDHDQQSRPPQWCGNLPYPASGSTRLLDFARRTRWAYMNYVEMLYGIYCHPGARFCDEEHQMRKLPRGMRSEKGRLALTLMKETILGYKAVGVFEEWELSMQLFNATVKSSVRSWDFDMSLNGGVTDFGRESLLQWAYASPDIHIALATDILLYEFALEVFKDQTKRILGKDW